MRYLWDQAPLYFNRERFSRPALIVIERLLERLRAWDRSTHPDRYIASSRFVAGRIRRVWGRESDVIHPPVDTSRFHPRTQAEDFYLVVSALAPYKRLDLAVAACRRLGRKLVVVGTGEERARLERLAGPDVRFLGWRSDAEVADLLGRCRALLFPGEEDFGITPLEAMASGRPVVALGKGGVLETVVNARGAHAGAPTGILFEEPTAEALADAMLELERRERDFDPARLRAHAERFSRPRFLREISEAIERFVAGG
jgi:glycosyltransferase involved in cell wall biosynthesis